MPSENRTVKISMFLQASNYVQGQLAASRATDKTRDAVAQAAAKMQAQREVMETTGRSSLMFGTLVAAGIAVAVKKYADFDQAMSNVIATGDDAKQNQEELRQAALDAGAATVFSATEAANAIEELAKAGVSARDILGGGLDASLSLAAAGGLEVADAAGIAATSMQQFNLRGGDMAHVADLLAAGAGKAMGDVSDLSMALNQVGLVANSAGLSIEETTAGLAAFASQGLLGSDAGTSFKAMLQRLTPQSAEAEAKMRELGISAYDASGNFVGLAEFAGNLRGALAKLTPEQRNSALATIFGSDAVRAANILYSEGEQGIREWTAAVDDQGYAARTAATRLDNLKGDVEALSGAFDTALIQGGSAANDTLRAMVQIVTELVTGYSELPEPVQATVMAVGGVTAAVALAGGAALVAVPKVAQFRAQLELSGLSLSRTALTAGAAGLALGGLFAIIGSLAAAQADARAKAQSYADTLEAGTNKITKSTREMAKEALAAKNSFLWIEQDSAYDAAEKLGIGLDLVTDAATGDVAALKELKKQLEDGAKAHDNTAASSLAYANSVADIERAVSGESGAIDRAIEIQGKKQEADAASSEGSKTAADAYLEAAGGASELNGQLTDLIDKINEANGVGQDAVSANAKYQAALAGISEEVQRQKDAFEEANGSLDGFALSLDESTTAGSANAAMLADVAGSAQDAALAQFELDQKTMGSKDAADKYAGTLAAQRQAFIDSATAAGFDADEVQKLADKVFALPSEKQIKILADAAAAQSVIDNFVYANDGRRITFIVDGVSGRKVSGSSLIDVARASGGRIPGPPSHKDNMIAAVASGEFVVNTRQTARNLAALEYINSGGVIQGYASGGVVQPRYASFMSGYSSQSAQVNVGAPSVQVFIGDEEVTGRVRVVVKDEINQVAKSARLGGGR